MSNYEMELAEASESEDEEPMATFEHGIICSTLNRLLGIFVTEHQLGRVVDSSVEYKFLESKETEKGSEKGKGKVLSRYPDVSFIRQERLPKKMRSYPEIAPDLAVEVTSPSDREYEIEAKIKEYQIAGVKLVWVIQPYSRRVDVYRLASGPKPYSYLNEDELDGEDVIPGLSFKVSLIFDFPPEEGIEVVARTVE
ncbi:MAG: Uma2 family endonuclease [Chloroflexi bacterium]|nr:Uma2 family endonuclease [Chloroflexota bacterium]